jgi:hypothetical protein
MVLDRCFPMSTHIQNSAAIQSSPLGQPQVSPPALGEEAGTPRAEQQVSSSGINATHSAREPLRQRLSPLEIVLLTLSVLIAGVLLLGLPISLAAQYMTYKTIIEHALAGQSVDVGGMLALARAWDFAIVKTSSLFMAFCLVFVGGAHVLRAGEAVFKLRLRQSGTGQGAFESSSPGLVMVCLGVALVVAVLYARTWVQYERPTPTSSHQPVAATEFETGR